MVLLGVDPGPPVVEPGLDNLAADAELRYVALKLPDVVDEVVSIPSMVARSRGLQLRTICSKPPSTW
jgi:hypothetical protein